MKLSEAVAKWVHGLLVLQRAKKPSVGDMTEMEADLQTAFDAIKAAMLDESKWDDDDRQAWKVLEAFDKVLD